MRRRTSWAVLVALALVAAACGNGEDAGIANGDDVPAAEERDYTFAYGSPLDASPLLSRAGDDMERLGPSIGISIRRFDNAGDAETTLENARLMVQENPDVAINWTISEGLETSLAQLYERADVPCISVNTPIPGCPFFNLVNRKVGIDAAEVVVPIAQEKGWTADDTTVILLALPGAGEEIQSGMRNFYQRVAETMGMDVVAAEDITDDMTRIGEHGIQLDSQCAIEPSFEEMRAALQTIPEDRNLMVFACNDDAGLGAWRAIENAGREDNTLIASSGGNEAALEQLRTNPSWVAENSTFFEFWGPLLLAMGVALIDGMEFPEQTFSPQLMLTKESVDEFYDGAEATRIPPMHPDNAYLEETGVMQELGIPVEFEAQ